MSSPARALGLVVVALLVAACSRSPGGAAKSGGAVPVVVATAVQKPMPVELTAIGNVQPLNSVTVRARVSGIVESVRFREGQDVREGDVLFTLDRRPLEAALRQAEANLARDDAQLANARKDEARYADLVRQGFVAQQQYDQVRTAAAAFEGTVRADRAAVDNARVQLGYATIRAPIGGRTGALLVHEGDVVTAQSTALLVINQIQPIDVAFALPERNLADVQRYRAAGTLVVDAVAPTMAQPLARGSVSFIDNRVDPATGTIQLKATFPNHDRTLWPGQYVNVVLTLTTQPDAVVVPLPAVQAGQQGRYVYVVRPDGTAESRPIQVAREVGQEAVIAEGVAPGDTVVTEGQLRLYPGARVEVEHPPVASNAR